MGIDEGAVYCNLVSGGRGQALATAGVGHRGPLWKSTSSKAPALPDTYYMQCLAIPATTDIMAEETLLAFADHATVQVPIGVNNAAAEQIVAAGCMDVDELGELLQRQGAKSFSANWATIFDAIAAKADRIKAEV